MSTSEAFTRASNTVAHAAGKPATFLASCAVVVAWAVSGHWFHYSDTWQLVINTGTTIVTFLMVFLIQNTQNRDGAAIQAKLDELIRASAAQNAFIGIERLTEEQLADIRRHLEAGAAPEGTRGEVIQGAEPSPRELARAKAAGDAAERRADHHAATAVERAT